MMNYEIHIGRIWDLKNHRHVPKQIITITEDQRQALVQFANITKDHELNNIYKINDCEFTIVPVIKSDFDLVK